MKERLQFFRLPVLLFLVVFQISTLSAQSTIQKRKAKEILDTTGLKGGLLVHLGCGDGELTAALHINDRYLVHGLDTNPHAINQARKNIQGLDLYGKVSVCKLDGRDLPYADNLVNMLIVENNCGVPMKECMRVLAPNGVLYFKSGNKWDKIIKPRPEAIDEWTHHLHDAGGNAVANDLIVGPPQHLQWTAGPLWARSHGWTPSVSAMVSTGGRLFYICDETLACLDGTVPSKWFLVARDAFSGVLLWKCPVPNWDSGKFSGTPDSGQGVASVGRFTMPSHIGKRLVAVDDTVYVTLGANAPVTALDAATGDRKQVYIGTANTDEILYSNGRLIVSINPSEKPVNAALRKGEVPSGAPGKHVRVVNAKTGRVLWTKGPFTGIRAGQTQNPFGRLELAAGEGKVFILTTKTIECFNVDSGKTLWRLNRPALPANAVRRMGFSGMFEYLLTVMVYHDGVVLLAQPEPNTHHTYHTMPGTLYAFDANNGRQMWKYPYGGWGHCTPPDVFVVDDVVWTHVNAETEFGSVWGKGFKAKDSSVVNYRIQALDLRSGKSVKELPTKEIFDVGHHHRCYRNKITERFLMSCRRGVEFVDLSTGENYQNHWVRSGCLLGYLPCNGLLYVTPHPCGCYINAKLTGFNALAPKRKSKDPEIDAASNNIKPHLVKGPAYGKTSHQQTARGISHEWPTYRHDPHRSGASESAVSTDLRIAWRTKIDTKTSSPVIANDKVFIAGVDTHTVYALNANTGQKTWSYTADSRVDSPPSLYNGLAIFGSTDGRVYCLSAADGTLVWRFAASPRHRLVTSFGQLESPWPIPGSVLVHDEKCWFAAGRSSYLDGGIRIYALDPTTGKVLHSETIYNPDPETGKASPETSANLISGLLNDIPATDGTNVFIRQMKVSSSGGREGQHLFTTGGYLDPSWFNRTLWQVGQARTSGLMVMGKDVAFGVEVYDSRSREAVFSPGAMAYRLKCLPLKVTARKAREKQNINKRRQQAPKPLWEQRIGIRVTAMIRTGDTIFVAGSPDVVDAVDPHGVWEGRKGGILAAFAADDGRNLAEYKLPAPPVWDGMAAADNRLFISTTDGNVVCLNEK
ncbi:MAG: PQQ-binding-like beta-propeller repeat protein [Planctomycetes bacterium]|nr:PQQ-binding-like beta-propeller repeat protein [Planctomycetota bacterium]